MSAQWLPWLADQPDDLRRVSRMVDLLIVADRATSETVHVMLAAAPTPATIEDARQRLEAVIRHLEAQNPA